MALVKKPFISRGGFDASGHRVRNVGTPKEDNDAVPLSYLKSSTTGIERRIGKGLPDGGESDGVLREGDTALITHELGYVPSVTLYGTSGQLVLAAVRAEKGVVTVAFGRWPDEDITAVVR